MDNLFNKVNKSERIKKFVNFDTEKPFHVYIDMDGVLTNFQQSFMGIKVNKNRLTIEEYDKQNGKFSGWIIVDGEGPTWWSHMPWMPDGKKLWNYFLKYDPCILSAPSRNPMSARGKIAWVNRELGLNVESATSSSKGPKWPEDSRMILSAQKYMFAKRYPNSILIDDTPNKIGDWVGNGGIGILHTDTESTIKKFEEIIANL